MQIDFMPPNLIHRAKTEYPLTTRAARRMFAREERKNEKKKRRRRPADRCANIDAAPPATLPATGGKDVTNHDAP